MQATKKILLAMTIGCSLPLSLQTATHKVTYKVKWDPVDATQEFQAAFNSNADTIVVENRGTWNVGRLTGTSNKTIILRPNVHILAKKGAFTANHHKMFAFNGQKNIRIIGEGKGDNRPVIEMRKSEYTDNNTQRRMHVFSLSNSDNVTFRNIIIKNTGGDGISLAGNGVRGTSDNILVENVVIDGARRNGMSIVNVNGLTIRNTIIKNTKGVNPQAGIDIETHTGKQESAINVLIENTIIENNKNSGIQFFMLGVKEDLGVKRCEVTVNNSTIRNNGQSGLHIAQFRDGFWKHGDHITIKNTLVEGNGRGGFNVSKGNSNLNFMAKSKDMPVIIDNTVFKGSHGYPFRLWKRAGHFAHTPGGVHFKNNTKIYDDQNRPWLYHFFERNEEPAALTKVTGEITIFSPQKPFMYTPYGKNNVSVKVVHARN